MHRQPQSLFRFEGFCLDLGRSLLVDPSGVEAGLRPKSFDVLRYLAENAGRLVSRDELMEAIWPSVFVTDDSVTQCVAEVRRTLGDAGQQLLRTVPKRGYIFTADVVSQSSSAPSRDVSRDDNCAPHASEEQPYRSAPERSQKVQLSIFGGIPPRVLNFAGREAALANLHR